MLIHVDGGGQPCQKVSSSEQSLFPHSTPGSRGLQDSPEHTDFQPATPEQQKQYAKARRAAKKAQRHQARKAQREQAKLKRASPLPLPDVPKDVWDLVVATVGERQARKSLEFVAQRRENFLDANPEIRAATTIENGLMAVDTALLNSSQKDALADFVGRIAR